MTKRKRYILTKEEENRENAYRKAGLSELADDYSRRTQIKRFLSQDDNFVVNDMVPHIEPKIEVSDHETEAWENANQIRSVNHQVTNKMQNREAMNIITLSDDEIDKDWDLHKTNGNWKRKTKMPNYKISNSAAYTNQFKNTNDVVFNQSGRVNYQVANGMQNRENMDIIALSDDESDDDCTIVKVIPPPVKKEAISNQACIRQETWKGNYVYRSYYNSSAEKSNSSDNRIKKEINDERKSKKTKKYSDDEDYEPPETLSKRKKISSAPKYQHVPKILTFLRTEAEVLEYYMMDVRPQEHKSEKSKFLVHREIKRFYRPMNIETLYICFEQTVREAIWSGGDDFEHTVMNISIHHPGIENGFVRYYNITYAQFSGDELVKKVDFIENYLRIYENLKIQVDVTHKNHRNHVVGAKTLKNALKYAIYYKQLYEKRLTYWALEKIFYEGLENYEKANPLYFDDELDERTFLQNTSYQHNLRILVVSEDQTRNYNPEEKVDVVRILKVGSGYDVILPS